MGFKWVASAFFAAVLAALLSGASAQAIDPGSFQPGRIIDDEVFYNKNAMSSVAAVQNFIDSHTPACDTWGTKPSGYGNLTRAQYAQQIMGWPGPPYVCLQNYYENPTTGETSFEKGGGAFAGGISAAQIIYDASQQYNINPQVLLVTLRKESLNLFADDWPLKSQYKYAMGYACPDSGVNYSAACVDSKAGFYKQMTLAAWQFRYYYDHMGTYNFAPGQWNTIQYNPDPGCGTKEVYIQNYATASLYIYTPYTPNDGALWAYPGTAPCGAYGNRNFWFMWQEWFGSPYADANVVTPLTLLSSVPGNTGLFTDGFVEGSFVIRNNSSHVVDVGYVGVAIRGSTGVNYDMPSQRVVLQPGQDYLYRQAVNLTNEDTYTFWITTYHDGVWDDNYPSSINGNARRYDNKLVQKKPTLTVDPLSNSENRIGKASTLSFTAVNNSAYPVDLGRIAIGMVSPSGRNADMAADAVGSLAPGATYVYSKQFTPTEVGEYKATVVQTPDNGRTWNNATYPVPTAGNDGRNSFIAKPSPTITQGPTLTTVLPRAGDTATLTFKVKNFGDMAVDAGYIGIAIRDPDNKNADINGVTLSALAAGSEYTFTGSRVFTKPGTYTAWLVTYRNGVWYDNSPVSEDATVARKITFTIKENPTLTQGLTISNPTPRAGETITGSFKVRNSSSNAVVVNKSLCYILRGNNKNYDLGCQNITTLAAGEEVTFSASRAIGEAGNYSAFFSMYDGAWHDNWTFTPETGSEPKTLAFTVKSNPTLTQGLALANTNLFAGDTATGSFKVKNSAATSVNVNKLICWIMRRDNRENYDLGCQNITTLAAGEEVTFQGSRALPAGSYKAFFAMYDGAWHDNWTFTPETGSEPKTLAFTVKSNPVLSQGLTVTNVSPRIGDTLQGVFKVRNTGSTSVVVNKYLCWIMRDANNQNADMGCLNIGTLAAGEEVTYNGTRTATVAGTYKAFFAMYDGAWHDNWTFDKLTGTEPAILTFTVAP
jgi:hypothetical protein